MLPRNLFHMEQTLLLAARGSLEELSTFVDVRSCLDTLVQRVELQHDVEQRQSLEQALRFSLANLDAERALTRAGSILLVPPAASESDARGSRRQGSARSSSATSREG